MPHHNRNLIFKKNWRKIISNTFVTARNKPNPPGGEGPGAGEGTPAAIYDRHPFASFAGLDASLSPLPPALYPRHSFQ